MQIIWVPELEKETYAKETSKRQIIIQQKSPELEEIPRTSDWVSCGIDEKRYTHKHGL